MSTSFATTQAREFALQFLYQMSVGKQFFFEENKFEEFCVNFKVPDFCKNHLLNYVQNTLKRTKETDELIVKYSQNWSIDRITIIDKVILRLALTEFLEKTTPSKVILDEYIDLSKKFGSEKSKNFINGILDQVIS